MHGVSVVSYLARDLPVVERGIPGRRRCNFILAKILPSGFTAGVDATGSARSAG